MISFLQFPAGRHIIKFDIPLRWRRRRSGFWRATLLKYIFSIRLTWWGFPVLESWPLHIRSFSFFLEDRLKGIMNPLCAQKSIFTGCPAHLGILQFWVRMSKLVEWTPCIYGVGTICMLLWQPTLWREHVRMCQQHGIVWSGWTCQGWLLPCLWSLFPRQQWVDICPFDPFNQQSQYPLIFHLSFGKSYC